MTKTTRTRRVRLTRCRCRIRHWPSPGKRSPLPPQPHPIRGCLPSRCDPPRAQRPPPRSHRNPPFAQRERDAKRGAYAGAVADGAQQRQRVVRRAARERDRDSAPVTRGEHRRHQEICRKAHAVATLELTVAALRGPDPVAVVHLERRAN